MKEKHSVKSLDFEKKAKEFGERWADGYINNHEVSDVFKEAQDWVKSLLESGEITFGYVRETYPRTFVNLEIGLCPIDSELIYFLGTEWYSDGEITHSYAFTEPYITKS